MEKVKTADDSVTLYSDKYKETFHTMSGAIEESFKKFVEPCNLKPGMTILEIGFGLGYNCLAAIHSIKKIKIIALEKDKEVLEAMQDLEVLDKFKADFEIVKIAAKNLHYKDDNIKIMIILGDAVDTIKELNEEFDAVFLDAFSPPKNPELWTLEFFKDVKKLMKKDAVLATYSYARKVRENLTNAGFSVRDGPVVGRRSPSTLAFNES
ncbi:MAG: class I SAM-dependent methyltransferase [Nanoarchaeota archaeon]|nr:class I SAM-dependent methyltransferase [Nanoarchaeota archaeon]MCG2718714.1 class I SAM-dependent methyltransferase [Nanoarchaeota archaeon]